MPARRRNTATPSQETPVPCIRKTIEAPLDRERGRNRSTGNSSTPLLFANASAAHSSHPRRIQLLVSGSHAYRRQVLESSASDVAPFRDALHSPATRVRVDLSTCPGSGPRHRLDIFRRTMGRGAGERSWYVHRRDMDAPCLCNTTVGTLRRFAGRCRLRCSQLLGQQLLGWRRRSDRRCSSFRRPAQDTLKQSAPRCRNSRIGPVSPRK